MDLYSISPQKKLESDNQKAVLLRIWIMMGLICSPSIEIVSHLSIPNYALAMTIATAVNWVLLLISVIVSFINEKKKPPVIVGYHLVLARIYQVLLEKEGFLDESPDVESEVFKTCMCLLGILISLHFLVALIDSYKNAVAFFNGLIATFCMVYRIYGFKNAADHLTGTIIYIIICFLCLIFFVKVVDKLSQLHNYQVALAANLQNEMQTVKKISKEYKEMFQNLEEAIVVIREGVLSF